MSPLVRASLPLLALALAAAPFSAPAAGTPPLEVIERDLRIDTALLHAGRPAAAIVIPDDPWFRAQAERISAALASLGAALPIELDTAHRDLKRLERNLIVLGDRDSNLALKKLYYLHYTLLDARFPGPGGSDLRSLHDPFGDGHNILTVGGSDHAGVARAVDWLLAEIARAGSHTGVLVLGRLQKTTLAEGLVAPASAKDSILWERSVGYGSQTHFGWNLLSRNLALLYVTGEEKFAREFERLAFPTPAIVEEIVKIDRENFDDPADPLVKPYHYDAIMMMLYWDLVEESPFFSPELRQRVNRKFAEQFAYHASNTYNILAQTAPYPVIGDRHRVWETLSAYVIARHFERYHSTADGRRGIAAADNIFHAFGRHPAMRIGTLYWYNTYIEPAFIYAALSDPLRYEGNPAVREYAAALGRLADRSVGDWASSYSTLFFLNLVASLTQDQGFADLVKDTGQKTDGFRLGQSYWPARPYARNYFTAAAGRIEAQRFDPAAMDWASDFPKEEVIDYLSYRQHDDARGDFVLVDSKYESGRNPFHNFALVSLRLDGEPLLRGYGNQLHIYRDGLFASDISRFTRVVTRERVGSTLVIGGEIRNHNGHAWRRTFLVRENQFMVVADRLTALTDTRETQVNNDWENSESITVAHAGPGEYALAPKIPAPGRPPLYTLAFSRPAAREDAASTKTLKSSGAVSRFTFRESLKRGQSLAFATVLRPGAPDASRPSAAQEGDLVALRLPAPALLSLREDQLILAEEGHLFAHQATHVPGLLDAARPVTADYDRAAGRLVLHSAEANQVTLLADGRVIACPAGEALAIELKASAAPLTASGLAAQVDRITQAKPSAPADAVAASTPLKPRWQNKGSAYIQSIVPVRQNGKTLFAVADGATVRLLSESGSLVRTLAASATVGALHWWEAKGLLLVGAQDESLRAFDLEGREKWAFTSEMAPELVSSRKFYWFKKVIPGVIALETFTRADGAGFVFVGGAGTVEILDADGKLQKRLWQTWGAVDGFTLQPAAEGRPAAMLCKRSMGGDPYLYEVTWSGKDWTQRMRRIVTSLDGTNLGGLGFSMVGRNFLFADRLAPDAPPRMIGDFNGAQNRLIVWDLEGKPLREADLGPGFIATGVLDKNYGRSVTRDLNVRGLAVLDLDGDRRKEVVVALDRRILLAFDQDLATRFLVRLPDRPVLLRAAEKPGRKALLAVAGFDGHISVIDTSGALVAGAKVAGTPTSLWAEGDQLLVGNDCGELSAFALPW